MELLRCRDENWQNLGIKTYSGKHYFTATEGNDLINDLIHSDTPFFAGKFGETELRTLYTFQNEWFHLNKVRITSCEICNNAGFFPRRIGMIKCFCKEYEEAIKQIDYLGMCLWECEEIYASLFGDSLLGAFSSRVLDPLLIDNPWTKALENKRVLIIHPFTESIARQYFENRKKIFKNSDLYLPEFSLLTIKAVQSIGGKGANGFTTWFDALEYMEKEIDKMDFDIALLGCGAYGLPLGSYIKKKEKQAIYMGGCLQLLFGILGSRWENQEHVKRFINEYWTRPTKEETPIAYSNVEGGCYW